MYSLLVFLVLAIAQEWPIVLEAGDEAYARHLLDVGVLLNRPTRNATQWYGWMTPYTKRQGLAYRNVSVASARQNYHHYTDVQTWADNCQRQYPALCFPFDIGASVQGRRLIGVRLTNASSKRRKELLKWVVSVQRTNLYFSPKGPFKG